MSLIVPIFHQVLRGEDAAYADLAEVAFRMAFPGASDSRGKDPASGHIMCLFERA